MPIPDIEAFLRYGAVSTLSLLCRLRKPNSVGLALIIEYPEERASSRSVIYSSLRELNFGISHLRQMASRSPYPNLRI